MGRALVLALLALLSLAACRGSEDAQQFPSETSGAEREIRGFSLTETMEGVRLWELHADYAYRIPRNSRIRLEHIELLFFDQEGKVGRGSWTRTPGR